MHWKIILFILSTFKKQNDYYIFFNVFYFKYIIKNLIASPVNLAQLVRDI